MRANPKGRSVYRNASNAITNAHLIVCDLEQDQLPGAKWVKELQGYGGDHRAEEAIQMVNGGDFC